MSERHREARPAESEIQITRRPVGRGQELDEIRQRLEALQQGENLFEAVIDWYGIPGIGKSTLLDMAEDLCREREITPFREFPETPEKFLGPGLQVFLLDDTDQISPSSMAKIEEEIIEPMVLTGRSLFVSARETPLSWTRFPVRRRVVSCRLLPLTEKETKEQISPVGARIHRLTAGHPKGNKILAEKLQTDPNANDQELVDILGQTIEKDILEKLPADLREALLVLAPVRQFDVVILRKLLGQFVPAFEETENFLKVIGCLNKTGLVEWSPDRGGYAPEPTLSHILALRLRAEQPDRFREIIQMTAGIFEDWTERIPDRADFYAREASYYRTILEGL